MHRLGSWAGRALGGFRGIPLSKERIAIGMGVSAAAILLSNVLEILATAAFYGFLGLGIAFLIYQWVQKPGGTA